MAFHKLKLTIDLVSFRDQDLLGNFYFKVLPIAEIPIKGAHTTPVQVAQAKIEVRLPNGIFYSFFEADKDSLQQKLSHKLTFEMWHQDRFKKDVQLGKGFLLLQDVKRMPSQKTRNSYCQALDLYLPIDKYQDDQPVQKACSLRVRVYLEDFGPSGEFREKEYEERHLSAPQSRKEQKVESGEMSNQLQSLQQRVVWQLQTWKKSQQQKFKIRLKQRQIQFLKDLAEQYRKRELQREKAFKKTEAALLLLEQKLRAKAADLNKREQRLFVLQQEMQVKIGEVSRSLLQKDQEMQVLQRKAKESVSAANKEKIGAEALNEKLRKQIQSLKAQIQRLKRQDQRSPLNQLKNELSSRMLELKETTRQLQKAYEIKEEYRLHCQRLKNQLAKTKGELNKLRQQQFRMNRNQIQALRQQLERLKIQQATQPAKPRHFRQEDSQEEIPLENEKERLKLQRQHMVEVMGFDEHDPLILEYDRAIRGQA